MLPEFFYYFQVFFLFCIFFRKVLVYPNDLVCANEALGISTVIIDELIGFRKSCWCLIFTLSYLPSNFDRKRARKSAICLITFNVFCCFTLREVQKLNVLCNSNQVISPYSIFVITMKLQHCSRNTFDILQLKSFIPCSMEPRVLLYSRLKFFAVKLPPDIWVLLAEGVMVVKINS